MQKKYYILILSFFILFSLALQLIKFYQLNSIAVYDQKIHSSTARSIFLKGNFFNTREMTNHLFLHFSPIISLYSTALLIKYSPVAIIIFYILWHSIGILILLKYVNDYTDKKYLFILFGLYIIFYPAFFFSVDNGVIALNLIITPLFLAFYGFLKNNIKFFLSGILIAMMVREEAIIYIIPFAAYYFLFSSKKKLAVCLILLSLSYYLIFYYVYAVKFAPDNPGFLTKNLIYLGDSPGKIIHSLLSFTVWKSMLLRRDNLMLSIYLFFPAMFIFLSVRKIIIIVPLLLLFLISHSNNFNLFGRYLAIFVPGLLFLSIHNILKLHKKLIKGRSIYSLIILLFLLLIEINLIASNNFHPIIRPRKNITGKDITKFEKYIDFSKGIVVPEHFQHFWSLKENVFFEDHYLENKINYRIINLKTPEINSEYIINSYLPSASLFKLYILKKKIDCEKFFMIKKIKNYVLLSKSRTNNIILNPDDILLSFIRKKAEKDETFEILNYFKRCYYVNNNYLPLHVFHYTLDANKLLRKIVILINNKIYFEKTIKSRYDQILTITPEALAKGKNKIEVILYKNKNELTRKELSVINTEHIPDFVPFIKVNRSNYTLKPGEKYIKVDIDYLQNINKSLMDLKMYYSVNDPLFNIKKYPVFDEKSYTRPGIAEWAINKLLKENWLIPSQYLSDGINTIYLQCFNGKYYSTVKSITIEKKKLNPTCEGS